MAKRMRSWNKNKYEQYLKAGRGQGEGPAYLPWISVQDFSSCGMVSRIFSYTTSRVHHFLSRNELNYFYLLEWSDKVLDIREQYPLGDMELATDVALKAGIRYPRDNISGFPYILTCDFMITTQNGLKARTIKCASELRNKRTLEKLEIERRYWQELGIDWRLVTENEIPVQKSRNIEWLYTSATLPAYLADKRFQAEILVQIDSGLPLSKVVSDFDTHYGLPVGSGLRIFKHLLWTKQIACEMESKIQLSEYYRQAVRFSV